MSVEEDVAVEFGDQVRDLIEEFRDDGLSEEMARAEVDLALSKQFGGESGR